MSKFDDVIKAPRTHPVGVLVTHIPLFLLWIAFAVRDLADGSVKMRGGGLVSLATEPTKFYVVAALIIGVAAVVAIRILQAAFATADKDIA